MKPTDRHHILWYKRDYNKGWAKRIREHWYCSIEIPRDTLHRTIHNEVSHIPVPRVCSIKSALEQLEMLEHYGGICRDDGIEKRLMVLFALFDCCEPATAEALKKQLEIVHKYNKKAPR